MKMRRLQTRLSQQSNQVRLSLPGLLVLASLFAFLEIALALVLGNFLAWGRAEALLFLTFRPAVLLAAAFLVSKRPVQQRLVFYSLFFGLAAASETVFLLGLGASDPWPEMARGLMGGAGLALVLDIVFQLLRRVAPSTGWRVVGFTGVAAFMLTTPFALVPYERMIIPREESPAGPRPDLMLMTALPIIWGEKGAFDPASTPAEAYKLLQAEFDVRPLDVLDEAGLSSGKLLLLAQPRGLNPEELVDLDSWVRRGGRALILTDPLLVWPTSLPLGDVRRPPAIGLLSPLLDHWGLRLEATPPHRKRLVQERLVQGRKLALVEPGHFKADSADCTLSESGLIARCAIGVGRAVLIADADLMHDSTWAGPGGAGRTTRVADNPLFIVDLLDELLGLERERSSGDIQWLAPLGPLPWPATIPIAAGLLPLILALAAAFILRRNAAL